MTLEPKRVGLWSYNAHSKNQFSSGQNGKRTNFQPFNPIIFQENNRILTFFKRIKFIYIHTQKWPLPFDIRKILEFQRHIW